MKFLDYVWRLLVTVVGFTIFGIGGLILGLIVFPLMCLIDRNTESRKMRARETIGAAFAAFSWYMQTFGVLDCQVSGLENAESAGNRLIIANHPTLIDVVLLIALFPRSNCVIKGAITRNPFMRFTTAAASYISNQEPEQLLASCVEYVQSGGTLMLFPEGTRTEPGQPIEFKLGAAAIIARSGANILPVVIDCTPLFLDKASPWHYVPPTKPQITIRVLPEVTVSELVADDGVERHVRRDLNVALLQLVNRELETIAATT